MLSAVEPWHLIVLVGVITLLFGAKRLPETARSIGQSLRLFRSEMDAAHTEPPINPETRFTRLQNHRSPPPAPPAAPAVSAQTRPSPPGSV